MLPTEIQACCFSDVLCGHVAGDGVSRASGVAEMLRQNELQAQTAKRVRITLSALGTMDGLESESSAAAATETTTSDVSASPKRKAGCSRAENRNRCRRGTTDQLQLRRILPDQKPTGPPSNPTGQQDDNPKRILGFIPNFQTKNDDPANQQPLTVKQKYILELHQTVDFSAHIGNLFQSALQQAFNAQPHYGQGWGPFAERFGAAEGDQATSAFFMFGFLPSILHDDPRYFRTRKGSVWSRLNYSATRTVVTRKDTGESTFNIPAGRGLPVSTKYFDDLLSARGSHRRPRV